jgi:hypothetical protein
VESRRQYFDSARLSHRAGGEDQFFKQSTRERAKLPAPSHPKVCERLQGLARKARHDGQRATRFASTAEHDGTSRSLRVTVMRVPRRCACVDDASHAFGVTPVVRKALKGERGAAPSARYD